MITEITPRDIYDIYVQLLNTYPEEDGIYRIMLKNRRFSISKSTEKERSKEYLDTAINILCNLSNKPRILHELLIDSRNNTTLYTIRNNLLIYTPYILLKVQFATLKVYVGKWAKEIEELIQRKYPITDMYLCNDTIAIEIFLENTIKTDIITDAKIIKKFTAKDLVARVVEA